VLNKVLQRRHVVHLDSRHSRPLKRTVNKFAIGFRRQLTTWHCQRLLLSAVLQRGCCGASGCSTAVVILQAGLQPSRWPGWGR